MAENETKFAAGAPLVIITGLSGAGKSTAMRFLEDLGCYCVDNLPPALIPDFFNLYEQSGTGGAGVVIASDVRSGALFEDFADTVASLKESKVDFKILFLDCDTETLIRRFKEVRRTHPLQGKKPISEAIDEERRRLEPIHNFSDHIIDTSGLDAAGLRETIIRDLVAANTADVVKLDFLSFGFKWGVPRDVDFVFDARFLNNPHYVPELHPLTGEDDAVYKYVTEDPLALKYFEKIVEIIELTLESFVKVGKTNLRVAIGCTGGRHRSVAFVRKLTEHFSKRGRRSTSLHRDVSKPFS
jgi:UPF0042 nucleotide-binding protein